jgi:hypothetical protein
MSTNDTVLISWLLILALIVVCLHLAGRLAAYEDAEREALKGWDGKERRRGSRAWQQAAEREAAKPIYTGAHHLVRETCVDCGVPLTTADHAHHCADCATIRMARECS